MRKTIVAAILAASVISCSPIMPTSIDGSKADGVVTLAATRNPFQAGEIDWQGALEEAKHRCRLWGYTNAKEFGAAFKTCEEYWEYGCYRYRYERAFQCF